MTSTPRAALFWSVPPVPSTRSIVIAGWSLAALGLAASLTLGAIVRQRLSIEDRLREDPLGLRSLPDVNELPPAPRLLLIGDSRAAHLGEPDLDGWHVINRGVSGQTAEQVAARFARDLVLLAPQHAVVIAGINDLKDGESEARVRRATAALTDSIRLAVAAGAPITVLEIWAEGEVGEPRRLLLPSDLQERVSRVNRELREIGGQPGATVVPTADLVDAEGHVPASHALDRGGNWPKQGLAAIRSWKHPSADPDQTVESENIVQDTGPTLAQQLTTQVLHRMRAFTEANGGEFLILSIPVWLARDRFKDGFPMEHRSDLPVFTPINQSQIAGGEMLYWERSHGHWTPLGCRLVAEALSAELDRLTGLNRHEPVQLRPKSQSDKRGRDLIHRTANVNRPLHH